MKEKKEKEKEHTIQNRNGKFNVVTLVASLVTIAGFGLTNLFYTSSAISRLEQKIERVRQESSQNYKALDRKISDNYKALDEKIERFRRDLREDIRELRQDYRALDEKIGRVNSRIDNLYNLISGKKIKEK